MMSFLEATILGIVQGITEFLPVSSSGHLVVVQQMLGLSENHLIFDVAVHLGTLLSVFVVYRKLIWQIVSENLHFLKSRKPTPGVHLLGLVILGTLPAAVIGFSFEKQISQLFMNSDFVIFGFLITGTLLFWTRNSAQDPIGSHFMEKYEKSEQMNVRKALLIGIAQAVAIMPGISRSGSTISTGLFLGMNRSYSAMFSFMLAIPVILGAGFLQLLHMKTVSVHDLQILGVGVLVAFATGVIALKLVLASLKKGRLHFFAYYVWALAAILIIQKFI